MKVSSLLGAYKGKIKIKNNLLPEGFEPGTSTKVRNSNHGLNHVVKPKWQSSSKLEYAPNLIWFSHLCSKSNTTHIPALVWWLCKNMPFFVATL